MILQFLINGLITGVLYSLLAIGFALVYNTTKVFHIAAAAIYVVAAYAFYTFSVVLGLQLLVAGLFSVCVTMFVSWGSEMLVYRPLKGREASLNVMMIASIGLMTILVNLVAMFYGNETKVIDNTIHRTYTIGNLIVTTPQMYQMMIGTFVIVAFFAFLAFSRYGLQLRALSADETLYETLGYNTNKTRTGVYLLSGAFIALASCLTVYDVGLDPHMGMNVLINAMVAMIIGGVGRFGTCVVGGMLLGILQALVVYQFASNWQNAITFVVLILFLFLRPQGIAGYKQRTV
ncbi:MAG: branched-chain amino acid ABC transporter permease [Bacteroidales bacterium]|nr:branched-chain amino acid ABC transporter permease [Bacteroidales bacterium]